MLRKVIDVSYFDDALADFVQNFTYGDAIRHLADKGYTAERIKKEFDYPLSMEKIEKIIQERNQQRKRSGHDRF